MSGPKRTPEEQALWDRAYLCAIMGLLAKPDDPDVYYDENDDPIASDEKAAMRVADGFLRNRKAP